MPTLSQSLPITCFAGACLAFIALTHGVGAMPGPSKATTLKGSDVMATVDGDPITRRELTDLWLKTDPRTVVMLGGALLEKWKTDGGHAPAYTVSSETIYATLYAPKPNQPASYAEVLSNLVSSRVLEREARRRGILVTRTGALAEAHRLFDRLRVQRGLKLTDEQMVTYFRLPRDIFLNDMYFRLRAERLIVADIAHRNGHPISPDDWIVVRELFASATSNGTQLSAEQQFAAAKSRVESWAQEVRSGKNMAEVAMEHNENSTKSGGGLLNPALRGTGTPAIEAAIFALKPGDLSAPLRGHDGWYVFQIERKGDQISAQERQAMWGLLVDTRRPQLIADLRKAAKITSIVPLPSVVPPIEQNPASSPSDGPPAPPVVPAQQQ